MMHDPIGWYEGFLLGVAVGFIIFSPKRSK